MDDWTKEQIEVRKHLVDWTHNLNHYPLQHMKSMGNVKSNAIYNPNEIRNPPPPNMDDTDRDSEIEQHIRCQ